jgi:hypothetical protein
MLPAGRPPACAADVFYITARVRRASARMVTSELEAHYGVAMDAVSADDREPAQPNLAVSARRYTDTPPYNGLCRGCRPISAST